MVALLSPVPPTFKDILQKLTQKHSEGGKKAIRARFATAQNALPTASEEIASPTYIPRDSKHFAYALLVVAGVPNDEACQEVAVSLRTAEGWRADLREVGLVYFKRSVTYDFAARFAVDEELRRIYAEIKAPP